ncbi:hypothetical protein NMY22_g13175 [Coprinellus aureogranulatus]|nr:hypothetical protein NMY22_g13175 [Coprinellus aureogranulatus]
MALFTRTVARRLALRLSSYHAITEVGPHRQGKRPPPLVQDSSTADEREQWHQAFSLLLPTCCSPEQGSSPEEFIGMDNGHLPVCRNTRFPQVYGLKHGSVPSAFSRATLRLRAPTRPGKASRNVFYVYLNSETLGIQAIVILVRDTVHQNGEYTILRSSIRSHGPEEFYQTEAALSPDRANASLPESDCTIPCLDPLREHSMCTSKRPPCSDVEVAQLQPRFPQTGYRLAAFR